MPYRAKPPRVADTIRKAAILVATLDRDTADALLAKMEDHEAACVRNAVLELDEISRDEQDEVIQQFLESSHHASLQGDDGVELDSSLVRKLQSSPRYDDLPRKPAGKRVPFQFLKDARTDPLVKHLERQHPQLIAVVVAHLPSDRAAEVVKRLAPRAQADVLRRVAELDQADPEIVRDIEEELEQLLAGELRAGRNRSAGLPVVAAILDAAGAERAGLLGNLAHHERELAHLLEDSRVSPPRERRQAPATPAETVRSDSPSRRIESESAEHDQGKVSRPATSRSAEPTGSAAVQAAPSQDPPADPPDFVTFDALEQWDDEAWATLIRAADPQIFLLALAGASETFVARIMRQLPARDAKTLRQRLEQAGPLRLADVDHAQKRIGELAARLASQGSIQLPPSRLVATA